MQTIDKEVFASCGLRFGRSSKNEADLKIQRKELIIDARDAHHQFIAPTAISKPGFNLPQAYKFRKG